MISPTVILADTLYHTDDHDTSHVLHLISDHRASQVGDLVAVQFNFAINSSSSYSNSQKKSVNLALGAGSGLAALPFLQFPTGYNGSSASASSQAKSDASSFSTQMMARVDQVMPSGALAISGDENVVLDGTKQVLHVRGTVRPEDIDNTDTVLSTRIANVEAHFDGNSKSDHHGLIQKVLDILF